MNADHERCRRLVWQASPETGEAEPGPYCVNEHGVFPLLDCPAFQGRECRCFEARDGEPEPMAEGLIREFGARLADDYLGWHYWRRIRALTEEE
ncbi:MAG: hypothetical protein ABFS86_02005 [Planctomycetota bacterium]